MFFIQFYANPSKEQSELAWKFALDVCTFDAMMMVMKRMMTYGSSYYPWIPLGLLYLGRDLDAIKFVDLGETEGQDDGNFYFPYELISWSLDDWEETWILERTLPKEDIFMNLKGSIESIPHLFILAAISINMVVKRDKELEVFLEILEQSNEESSARKISESWPVLKLIKHHMEIDKLENQAVFYFDQIYALKPNCFHGLISCDFNFEKATLISDEHLEDENGAPLDEPIFSYDITETIVTNFWPYFNVVLENGYDYLKNFLAAKEETVVGSLG